MIRLQFSLSGRRNEDGDKTAVNYPYIIFLVLHFYLQLSFGWLIFFFAIATLYLSERNGNCRTVIPEEM